MSVIIQKRVQVTRDAKFKLCEQQFAATATPEALYEALPVVAPQTHSLITATDTEGCYKIEMPVDFL